MRNYSIFSVTHCSSAYKEYIELEIKVEAWSCILSLSVLGKVVFDFLAFELLGYIWLLCVNWIRRNFHELYYLFLPLC